MVDIDRPTAVKTLATVGPEWTHGELRGWTTFARADGTVVHLGLLRETDAQGTLLEGHKGPADAALRLQRYESLTGSPWRITAGVSACQALRDRYNDPRPGRQPLWRHKLPKGIRGAGPLVWRSPEQPQPDNAGIVHVFDINAQYLAALRNASLAWGKLEERGSIPFDPSWPGFWEIETTHLPAALYDGKSRPPVFPANRIHKGAAWLSTPVVKYLCEFTGDDVTVLDSLVSDNGHPIGRAYAERLMKAREGTYGPAGPAAFALKRSYAELLGMMARDGGSIERADWAAQTMDLARVNFLRRVSRAYPLRDVRALAVQTDAIYFLCGPEAERELLPAAIGLGTGAGTFKYVGTLTVEQYREKLGIRS